MIHPFFKRVTYGEQKPMPQSANYPAWFPRHLVNHQTGEPDDQKFYSMIVVLLKDAAGDRSVLDKGRDGTYWYVELTDHYFVYDKPASFALRRTHIQPLTTEHKGVSLETSTSEAQTRTGSATLCFAEPVRV